ncbi:MAG: ExbD/TolR family protein [Bacteroidales bacterium]|jgi:biopolymer transport protein ExbD|nr:biopolymer transporter ExbD [Bacteroidales bacterium]NLP20839.1 biopolymer transporter ExbD [Bacteroidales bacterium]OQC45258.1 MAG: Biopolymer transport protein ExbD/TolR [Bacteroidetes bacterium ADurb.Bin028]HOD87862.1 biopolymer transporter ExbD [Bacteroidales bacterium]
MAKRETPEVNSGSLADIAFLLLIYWLLTTTMDVDTGIARQLPPIPEKSDITEVDINKRNIFIVLINSENVLRVNGKERKIEELRELTKEFVKSNPDDPSMPELESVYIEQLNKRVDVGKGVISLQNDRGTSYGTYIMVQNELVAAVNELRDEAAYEYFGKKSFDNLSDDQKEAVRKIVPQRISEAEPKNIGGK